MNILQIPLLLFAEQPLAVLPESRSWVFILFLVCFFIIIHTLSRNARLVEVMMESVFRNKERQNLFSESVNREFVNKILLLLQTLVLSSIIVYGYDFFHTYPPQTDNRSFYFSSGAIFLALSLFLLYKWIMYNAVGAVFFRKESLRQWNEFAMSLLCLSGLVLFLPALLFYYVPFLYTICYYFFLIYAISCLFLLIRKAFVLFFQDSGLFLYFILYLCAQEIIPLYFMYRALVYLLNFVQKDTLWLLM